MAKLSKNQKVPLAQIVIDRTRNVREQDDATYRVDALRDDIALRGQITPGVLEIIGKDSSGKPLFSPIQGFLRATALTELAADKKTLDPATVKRDDKGEPIPGTGKPFEFMVADVWEGLDEKERTNLLVDHGQRRGLTVVELHYAMERLFNAGYSEKDVATMCRSLLEIHYPPNKTISTEPERVFQYYRGVIQTAKEAWRGPVLMRNAWVEKLKGLHRWPTKAEMMDGVKIFKTAQDKDTSGKINRENPGPEFMEFWDRLLKAQEKAELEGPNAQKSVSMLSRGQVEDCARMSNSRIGKAYFSIVLNDGKVDRSKLPNLDGLVADLEKSLTADQLKILDSLFASTATVEPTVQPEQPAAEPEVEAAK